MVSQRAIFCSEHFLNTESCALIMHCLAKTCKRIGILKMEIKKSPVIKKVLPVTVITTAYTYFLHILNKISTLFF